MAEPGPIAAAAPTRPAAEWVALAKARESSDDLWAAFDFAERGLVEYPDDVQLRYLAVRALADSHATHEATELCRRYDLEHADDDDIASIYPRLLKDEARLAPDAERPARLVQAADAYARIFQRTGKYYQGVNAATLLTLAGETGRAAPAIAATAAACNREAPEAPGDVYFLEATRAELALLQGYTAAAMAALTRAMAAGYRNWARIASTRRQLLEICRYNNLPAEVLAALRAPRIIHYLGHMIAPHRFPADQEAAIAGRIAAYLAEHQVGFAYGSLACGADILFAEAVLARQGELHVVLPFDDAEFKQLSVARGGPDWVERFDACRERAKSVHYATEDDYLGDDALFSYASRLAMGLAILRAKWLDAEVGQVAVWDGGPAGGLAGTAIDIEFWRSKGRKTDVIPVTPAAIAGPVATAATPATGEPAAPAPQRPKRVVRALLFGDFHGYSAVREHDVPVFQQTFMRAVADVLDQFGDQVIYRNSWGDAVYVVMLDAVPAARCALAIQNRLAELGDGGLPVRPQLRLGGHFSPTFAGYDAIRKEPTYFGAQVTRAARLEPVTPLNMVYITEPFAAALALDGVADLSCEYVGEHPMAKNYGSMRMCVLRNAG